MKIETIRVQNFKSLQNIEIRGIPALAINVGANGSGKSTVFDIFGFLKDCLTYNVTRAMQSRGGYPELVSRGQAGKTSLLNYSIA